MVVFEVARFLENMSQVKSIASRSQAVIWEQLLCSRQRVPCMLVIYVIWCCLIPTPTSPLPPLN